MASGTDIAKQEYVQKMGCPVVDGPTPCSLQDFAFNPLSEVFIPVLTKPVQEFYQLAFPLNSKMSKNKI